MLKGKKCSYLFFLNARTVLKKGCMCRDDRQGIVSAMRIPDRKIKCQFLDEPKQCAGLYSMSPCIS